MKALIAAGLLVASISDHGQYAQVSPEIRQWFNGLANQKGGLCCSMADGRSVDDPDWEPAGDHYRVRVDGEWVDVPDQAIVTGINRIGRAIVWPRKRGDGTTYILCFMVGTLT